MFKPVLDSLQQFGPFSSEEITLVESKLVHLSFKKDEPILREGKVCQAFYYILQGSSAQFYNSEEGIEHVVNLYVKDDWFTEHKSLTSQKPAQTHTLAFEDCQLAMLDIHAFHFLVQSSPIFFKIGMLFNTVQYSDIKDTLKTPEQQYLRLLEKRPGLIKTFPLKYLASYLRMAPETLSRIRKRIQSA